MKPLLFRGIPVAVSADIERIFPYFNSPNAPALLKYLREQSYGPLAAAAGEAPVHFVNSKLSGAPAPANNPGSKIHTKQWLL